MAHENDTGMVEDTHPAQQALDYLSGLESALGHVMEAYPPLGRLHDEDPNAEIGIDLPHDDGEEEIDDYADLTTTDIVQLMDALVTEEEWDEEQAALYIVQTELDYDGNEDESRLVGEVLDAYYEWLYENE